MSVRRIVPALSVGVEAVDVGTAVVPSRTRVSARRA
jgi:hypothetical protein